MNVDADNPLHFSEICRLCLSKEDMMTPIFEEDDKTKKDMPSLATRILMCASLQVEEGDGFPSQICTKCSGHLDNWYAFKEQCHSSDATLRQHLQTDSKIVTASSGQPVGSRNASLRIKRKLVPSKGTQTAKCRVTISISPKKIKTNKPAVSKKANKIKPNKLRKSRVKKNPSSDKEIDLATSLPVPGKEDPDSTEPFEYVTTTLSVCGEDENVLMHPPKPYQCSHCSKSFTNRYSLRYHESTHTGVKHCFCPQCGKGFFNMSSLKVHQQTHSSEKPYLCNLCGKSFKIKNDLSKHHVIHTDQFPYLCNVCGKTWKTKSRLSMHLHTHSPERNHMCPVCGKSFRGKNTYMTHLKTHSNERPLSCPICDKDFKLKKSLNKHMRVHIGKKPFQCTFCERAFSDKWNLTQHIRLHTGDKPYVCAVCGEAFTHNVTLRNHAKQHSMPPPDMQPNVSSVLQ